LITIVGNLPELSPGENVVMEGEYRTHAKHGLQLHAVNCQKVLPATLTGIERYLGSGLIKGIGPQLAKRIVKHFKEDTLEIIEESPVKLKEVPGIGEDRTEKIVQAWEEQRQIKEIMIFLHGHQITTNLAVKIFKTYGNDSLKVVKQNPYQLERDIFGVGFKTADRIARNLGLPKEHPSRIEAGNVFVLNDLVQEGHVYLPAAELIDRACSLLEVPSEMVKAGLERLSKTERVKLTTENLQSHRKENGTLEIKDAQAQYGERIVYPASLYHCETSVSEKIVDLQGRSIGAWQAGFSLEDLYLSDEQKSALENSLNHPVSVLTGGPGTGKTTCLKSLIKLLEDNKLRYALASPTGRAAKRLSDAAGRPACTIHRLLGFSPNQGYQHHDKNPLKIDFLVIDEASMLDLVLTYHLLSAIKPGTHVLFVGDVDQLPSVGAGDVLRDIIKSEIVPVSRLTKIYRQEQDSLIIYNAHRINQGKYPIFSQSQAGDFYLFPAKNAEEAAKWILELVSERIPKTFGMDPLEDIQVLVPMYRGAAGVDALNNLLQGTLNPPGQKKAEAQLFGRILRVGDKVMQIRNNYDKDVFNGDIGRIIQIDRINQTLKVRMDDQREVVYDFSEADELVLAYAISVHKSQGSEFPAIVMPVITQHYIMLQRNLLYTGVTRAKNLCVLVGNSKALRIGIGNNQVAERNSLLAKRIQEHKAAGNYR
jgi:exodeoxyribonuclease V alpha subunit